MLNYAKLHDLISHRVTVEYGIGARVTGYLASCQPSSGPVEFCVLSDARIMDSRGHLIREEPELTLCPNMLTSIALDEGLAISKSKLHGVYGHRVTLEYDTGARVTGELASCQPGSGAVEFCTLSKARLIDSRGRVVREPSQVTVCPNVLMSIAPDEGPRGRDLAR